MSLSGPELGLLLGLPLVVGCGLARALGARVREDAAGFLGLAWVAGALATGALGYLLFALDADPSAGLWNAGLALVGIVAFALGGRRKRGGSGGPASPESDPRATSNPARSAPNTGRSRLVFGLERAFFGLVLALALVVTWERIVSAGHLPVVTTDEAHIWAVRAKVLFLSGGFNADYAAWLHGQPPLSHADYPLLNPLLQARVFAQAGGLVHFENRLPIQLFAPALILLMASALRRRLRPGLAGLLLLLLPALRMTAQSTYRANADLMVATGFLLAADFLLRFRASGAAREARIACVGLALCVWSKNDGLLPVLALACAWAVDAWVRRGTGPLVGEEGQARKFLPWSALPLAAVLATWGLNARFGFESDIVAGGERGSSFFGLLVSQAPERIVPVLRWFATELFGNLRQGQLVVPLALVVISTHPRRVFGPNLRFGTLTWLAVLGGYVLVYVGSHQELAWHLETSSARVVFQALPFTLLWLAEACATLDPRARSNP